MDSSQYCQISSSTFPEHVIGLHKNSALFEFVKQYSNDQIKKLIFSTMEAITNITVQKAKEKHKSKMCTFELTIKLRLYFRVKIPNYLYHI